MPYTRKNVWELGGPWADPILWYARAVAVMKKRPLNAPTGWRFYGAIHGFDTGLWTKTGYLAPSDPMPNQADKARFWEQCQHGSWYFLPWHRGYLLAFEANIRAAIKTLGGPDWALPYWNYFKPHEAQLPPAFASPDWPDGKGNNPLFVTQRYGPDNNGKVYVPLDQVNLDAMNDPDFTGVPNGDRGFGGIDTGFEHGGKYHGQLEQQPHDQVHGLVGGGTRQKPGIMSYPQTAGLDPIFWLHHANIDRLWQVWRQNPPTNADPPEANWVKGPASIGERKFSMPMPDGTAWDYTPGDMGDLAKLGYTYDDLSPAVAPAPPAERLLTLGASAAAVAAMKGVAAVASGKNVELVGANQASLKIEGAEARTSVQLDAGVQRKVSASLAAAAETAPPDRVFLNLENVRGLADETVFQVYVGVPEDAEDPAHFPERRAGSIALFGVSKATGAEDEQAGQGLSFSLDITKVIDALHVNNALDADALSVRIVPRRPVPADEQISIGRVSVFRQGR